MNYIKLHKLYCKIRLRCGRGKKKGRGPLNPSRIEGIAAPQKEDGEMGGGGLRERNGTLLSVLSV